MPKDEFFQSVRTAVRFLAPRVETDSPYLEPEGLERGLANATIWLTPKSVEGFDPADFSDLPSTERNTLVEEIEQFVAAAEDVPSHQPARADQVERALPHFRDIVSFVQRTMREEWVQSANRLLDEAQGWAQARDWPIRRYPKRIAEDLLGTYTLDKLVFAAEGSQLVLNPVGRFAPRTEGIFDLAVLPVYESMMVVRQRGRWFIESPPDRDERWDWSEAAFVETARKLARLA
jgi:hypothetical protein